MNTKSFAVILARLCVGGSIMMSAPPSVLAVAWRWPIYCFFGQGSEDLTDRCHQVIKEAVASWHREQEGRQYKSDSIDPKDPYAPPYRPRLTVLGYAPDATSPDIADRLSVRRAAAVARELEQLGIPEDMVTIIGLGDKWPLIPDSPADPQNRMVSIRFY